MTQGDDDQIGVDDFHDLGLCPDCERDMTIGQSHATDCPLARRFADDDGPAATDGAA